MNEALTNDNEFYPQNNALEDLTNICQWASDAGMYVLIDLHGMPGAQKANEAFTGRVSYSILPLNLIKETDMWFELPVRRSP